MTKISQFFNNSRINVVKIRIVTIGVCVTNSDIYLKQGARVWISSYCADYHSFDCVLRRCLRVLLVVWKTF